VNLFGPKALEDAMQFLSGLFSDTPALPAD
jgi:hypothetical protein